MKRLMLILMSCLMLAGCAPQDTAPDSSVTDIVEKDEAVTEHTLGPEDFGVPKKPVDKDVVLHYDMTHYRTELYDMSGYGNHGTLHAIGDGCFYENGDDKILSLPGTGGSYVDIPLSVAKEIKWEKGFSVEMTFTPKTEQHQFLWSLGTGNQTNYLRINPANPYGGYFEATIKTQTTDRETTVGKTEKLPKDKLSVTTVTYDGKLFRSYANGKLLGEWENDHDLSLIFAGDGNSVLGWIAKSNWPDPYADATVTDFKIYSKTLSDKEIENIYSDLIAKEALRVELKEISVPEYSFDRVSLPTETSGGAAVKWESDSKLLNNGRIENGDTDTQVKLTATLTANGVSISKDYTITMVAKGDEGRLNFISNRFDLGITHTDGNIALPDEFEGVAIRWEGDGNISSDGTVTRSDRDTASVLKATFEYNGVTAEKELSITVIGKSKYTLCTYIARYEPDMGSEFAEFPSGRYTDNARTDIMYYALSENGTDYTELNNGRAVLYPETTTPNFRTPFTYQLGTPSIFRKADGSYGVISTNNGSKPYALLFDSSDLIFFTGQRELDLGVAGVNCTYAVCDYNSSTRLYEIKWIGSDGKGYVSYSYDLKTVSSTEEAAVERYEFTGELPVYAKIDEASVFELSLDEYERLTRKFSPVQSVAVQVKDIEMNKGEDAVLPEYVTVKYSDGSEKNMAVEWDTNKKLSSLKKGEYEFEGKVINTAYEQPFARYRADPQIQYIEKDDKYYFTSSYMQGDTQNAYRYVILRSADTIEGLSDAEGGDKNEVIIWSEEREGDANPWYWAPEMHYFGGKYNIIFLSTYGEAGWRMTIISCDGNKDPMNPKNWSLTGTVNPDPSGKWPGAFDTTFFKLGSQCYYVSPTNSAIWIAKFDENDPLNMTTNLVMISNSSYPWEYNVGQPGQACDHQYVEEGGYVMFSGDKIFITYACATVDNHYCIGLLYADVNSDLTDPENWHKYPMPLLATRDLTETVKEPVIASDGSLIAEGEYTGSFGPGHNSITYDRMGNPVVVYHARVWGENYVGAGQKYGLGDPGRHAFVRNIHFGYDGFPIMNMTPEQELAEHLRSVKIKVTVK